MGLQIAPRMGEEGVGVSKVQMRALRLVWSEEGVTLMDITKTLKRDKAQVTRLIDELVKAELVMRVPNPDDGRSKILRLTDGGVKLFERVEAVEAQFSEKLIRGIEPEDLAAFYRVADQLSDNLKNIEADI